MAQRYRPAADGRRALWADRPYGWQLAAAVGFPALVVEVALEDDGGGHGVDLLLALVAAGALGDEGLLGDGGRHPLVVVLDREADRGGKLLGEGAGGLGLRALAAGEADREADDEASGHVFR